MSALTTLTASAVCCVLADEQVDEQIQLRDDVIFRQKQEMATQQQKIEELKNENEELRSQVSQGPIKEEGIHMLYVASSLILKSYFQLS